MMGKGGPQNGVVVATYKWERSNTFKFINRLQLSHITSYLGNIYIYISNMPLKINYAKL